MESRCGNEFGDISQSTHNLITSGDLPPTASNLIIPQPCTTCFYLLPKIHQSDCPGRPIVSACFCPTELILTPFSASWSRNSPPMSVTPAMPSTSSKTSDSLVPNTSSLP
eukprot:g11947.t1